MWDGIGPAPREDKSPLIPQSCFPNRARARYRPRFDCDQQNELGNDPTEEPHRGSRHEAG
jgi:hypothetical protein